jgi:hypothetical protein
MNMGTADSCSLSWSRSYAVKNRQDLGSGVFEVVGFCQRHWALRKRSHLVAEVECGDGVDLQLHQRLKALPFASTSAVPLLVRQTPILKHGQP